MDSLVQMVGPSAIDPMTIPNDKLCTNYLSAFLGMTRWKALGWVA